MIVFSFHMPRAKLRRFPHKRQIEALHFNLSFLCFAFFVLRPWWFFFVHRNGSDLNAWGQRGKKGNRALCLHTSVSRPKASIISYPHRGGGERPSRKARAKKSVNSTFPQHAAVPRQKKFNCRKKWRPLFLKIWVAATPVLLHKKCSHALHSVCGSSWNMRVHIVSAGKSAESSLAINSGYVSLFNILPRRV